jgi:hypothetical protein
MEHMLDRAAFLLGSLASSLSVTARAAPTHAPTVSTLLLPEIVLVPDGPIDVLSPVTVRVGIRNRSDKAIDVAFANAETFLLEIREKDRVLWSSAFEHKPIEIGRTISIAPGVFQLANYVLEGTTNDRRALASGTYTVHVEMLGKTFAPIVDKALVYAPPLPIDRALKAKNGAIATIVGTPAVMKGLTTLSDGTGTIRLSRALGIGAVGIYAVHGYVDINELGTQFSVARFMPLRDLDEKPDPTPSPSSRP